MNSEQTRIILRTLGRKNFYRVVVQMESAKHVSQPSMKIASAIGFRYNEVSRILRELKSMGLVSGDRHGYYLTQSCRLLLGIARETCQDATLMASRDTL